MPRPRLPLVFILPVCLLPSLLLAAATAPAPRFGQEAETTRYTVQPGDTLTGIARKHGLSLDDLAKVNDLDKPHRLVVGNVLRLPVTPPENALPQPAPFQPVPSQPAPFQPAAQGKTPGSAPGRDTAAPRPVPSLAAPAFVPAKAADPAPAAAPIRTTGPAAKPAEPAKVETPAPQPAPIPASQVAAVAKPPLPAPTPAAAPQPAARDELPDNPAKLAVGVYTNPVLGSLRLSQTPTGIALIRDNQTIPMGHLLYSVFDGSDNAGAIHGLRLEYDGAGQVTSLLYSTGSARDIPFTRTRK